MDFGNFFGTGQLAKVSRWLELRIGQEIQVAIGLVNRGAYTRENRGVKKRAELGNS